MYLPVQDMEFLEPYHGIEQLVFKHSGAKT